MPEFCHAGKLLRKTVTWRFWFLCWSRRGVCVCWGEGHNPSHCLGPFSSSTCWSLTTSAALTLITTCGGWCYRKPETPGEIALLHGDSPLFTSSLTGGLKEERKERRREGKRWGDYEGRREGYIINKKKYNFFFITSIHFHTKTPKAMIQLTQQFLLCKLRIGTGQALKYV